MYEASKLGTVTETVRTLEGTRAENDDWELLLNGYRAPVWGNEHIVEIDNADGCNNGMSCYNATELHTENGLNGNVGLYIYFTILKKNLNG